MPLLIVISGPSAGVGKGTIIKELLKRNPNLYLSKSVTTRPKRDYETDGVEYYFRSEEEFDKLLEKDAFLEWNKFLGSRYGTLQSEVEAPLKEGKDVILEIEVNGAKKIKNKNFSNALFLFIKPPTFKHLAMRLKKRGTEDNKSREKRLRIAREELKADFYDYYVVNEEGKIMETVFNIEEIIDKEKKKR